MPWGPARISFRNDRIANQAMGDTSRPLNGLMIFLVGASTGSVGGQCEALCCRRC